ncbi:MAG: hypothetical protein AAFQ89_06680 [Cyanobacteria bacterium J06626_18]
MFSLRRDQFRAILFGILIADALSHQHLSGSLVPLFYRQTSGDELPILTPVAIASNHWCQQITTVLQDLTCNRLQPHSIELLTSNTAGQTASMSGVDTLLLTFPWLIQGLACLDAIASDELMEAILPAAIAPASRTAMRAFYRAAAALLKGDESAMDAIWQAETDATNFATTSLGQAVARSCEQVCLADGDFAITMAQSLKASPLIPGLPILSGFLSACWVGGQGIPTRWLQALLIPSPMLQQWLKHRWYIDNAVSLYKWGACLNDLWLGRQILSSQMTSRQNHPAVQFAIEPTSWPDFR